MVIEIKGDSREAALITIVKELSYAEHKNFGTTTARNYNRDWVREAFAFARECLDGPPAKKAEDFLTELAHESH